MNQAITSQALSFCPVIPAADEPEGQIRDAEGNVWIQIKADHASDAVSYTHLTLPTILRV